MAESFDVVIVGAGSAGCVLAERLSRDPDVKVLLMEAGGSDWNPLISIPIGARVLSQHKLYEWHDVSDADPMLNGRRNSIPHGRVMGGSSSLNYMAVVRGKPAAYEGWVAEGARGWGYEDVLPFFKECEDWEKGGDGLRGGAGEVGVTEGRLRDPIHKAWLGAVQSLQYRVVADYNSDAGEGFGPAQYSVRKGRRSSAARSFLRTARKRPNLTIRTHAKATKILFSGSRAIGVDYLHKGKLKSVRGTRTVLSLGAINTPHLLMLSGVGPAAHLAEFGIPCVANLPVGKGLEDHLGFPMFWTRKSPGEFHEMLRLDRIAASMVKAYLTGRGRASVPPAAILGFVKSRPDKGDVDLEIILSPIPEQVDFWFPGIKKPFEDGYAVRVWLLGQKSRGEVLLRSDDPHHRPRIIYNSLSAPGDLETLRDGFRRAWAIGNSPELAAFRGRPKSPPHELISDADIDAFIQASAYQMFHPACTCKMGAGDDAVLNPDLSVRGLEGLNVVDASAMPHLPSGGPNIVITMMAAKAAAMWKENRGGA